jgi:hypothetical protein
MKPVFETIKLKKEVAITFIENSPTYVNIGKELRGEVVSIYTAGKNNNTLIAGAAQKGEEIMVWIVKDLNEVWIIPYADIKDVEYIK